MLNVGPLDVNAALGMLLDKYLSYNRPAGIVLSENFGDEATHVSGQLLVGNGCEKVVPLFPWRLHRKFIELKSMFDNQTLGALSTLRFAASDCDASLDALLYRELDLCEWISGSRLERLYAVAAGEDAINILARLENKAVVSIAVSTSLPENAQALSRHEIITGRGVASDLVVDTQVPQNSIYIFGENGETSFCDTDAELYGMSEKQIALVRSAYKAVVRPSITECWQEQHLHLCGLLELVYESIRDCKRVVCE